MEQFPERHESIEPERPLLILDLSNSRGDVQAAISSARCLLAGEHLDNFDRIIDEATVPGTGKRDEDVFAVINSYFILWDISGTYPGYSREGHIMAAIERLNEQLQMLPGAISYLLEGLYPDCESDVGPQMYLALLNDELAGVEAAVEQCNENQRGSFEQYKEALLECVHAFHLYGVR